MGGMEVVGAFGGLCLVVVDVDFAAVVIGPTSGGGGCWGE